MLSRRRLLAGMAGTAGLGLLPAALAACGPGDAGSPSRTLRSTSLGSNYSDPVPRAAIAEVIEAFRLTTGIEVTVNTQDAASFQDQIGTYLQGRPDDVVAWSAGNRMRFFAGQGLLSDLTPIWPTVEANLTPAAAIAATGDDGRPYLVPFQTYPWVLIHRRSVWRERGYEVPSTWDELVALAARMESDGLVPFAFGDRDGWPAMGTFDILDLRLNGYDFHLDLAAGREPWTDRRVRAVFETWRELLPFQQRGSLGRTWQEATQAMLGGDAAMIFGGAFFGEQAAEADRDDLDLFPFPLLGTEWDDERAIDAPVNGFMLARQPRAVAEARALLEFLSTGDAQAIYVTRNPNRVAVATDADTSGYTDYQRKMADVLAGAGRLAQFLDRDSRPDFTGPTGMQSFLQDFLADPDQDLGLYLEGIQAFRESLD